MQFDMDDEITEQTMLTRDGEVVQRRVREIFGIDTAEPAEVSAEGSAD